MTGGWPLWTGSVLAAVAFHGAGAALVAWMAAPEAPAAKSPGVETRLDVAVVAVPRTDARGAEPEARAADTAAPEPRAVSGGAVPRTSAAAAPFDATPLSATSGPGASLPPLEPGASVSIAAAARAPTGRRTGAVSVSAQPALSPAALPTSVPSLARPAQTVQAPISSPSPTAAMPVAAAGRAATLRPPDAPSISGEVPAGRATLGAAPPDAPIQAAFRPEPVPAPEQAASGWDTQLLAPSTVAEARSDVPADAPSAAFLAAEGPPVTPAAPDIRETVAALAWTGGAGAAPTAQALDVVGALIADSGRDAAQSLRDGISGILSGADCARVQTVFRPETGGLEVIGHVPDAATGARIASAIEAEIGGALPVTARLRQLPPPQCTVLAGLTGAGIAQSTDQFTNPLIIGPDLFARAYDYAEGDSLKFEIAGAEFDAWLYLDYFDSSGQVTHLVPNAAIPPVRLAADASATFGVLDDPRDIAYGRIGEIVVGPPFGQDIAVVLIASTPLFEDIRPAVEEAGSYLDDLARRVADLRRTQPDLKIEFVYLFVETSPR